MKILKIVVTIFFVNLVLTSCSSSKTTVVKDGSSINNAIKVGSVDEEYQIVQKKCPTCRVKSQSLIMHGKKNYDSVSFEDEKGEEFTYYFEISSFFGKY